jgi:hypothetical protein
MKAKTKPIDEKKFSELLNNPLCNVTPQKTGRVYNGATVIKRKLDGQSYIVQPYANYIKIFSNSQLRLMYVNTLADEKRIKIIQAELIKRKALAKK